MRRGINAISAGAEIDAIEVDFEDLILGETVLEPQRKQSLPDFAGEAAFRRQKQVLGELLGYRAAALDDTAGREIDEPGAQKPDRIDAEMAVEAAILGGDYRFRQIGRHLLQGQGLTEKIAECRQEAAVGREDRGARAPLTLRQLAGIGQGEGKIAENAGADDRRPQQQQDRDPG